MRAGLALLTLTCTLLTVWPTAVRAQAPPAATAPTVAERRLKVCVASNAAPEVRAAAQSLLGAIGTNPLLRVLVPTAPPTALTDSAALLNAKTEERAYSHLVIVGLMDDPLIKAVSQREAHVAAPGTLYAFGFGWLAGDIGWIESDRNPFLHGAAIRTAPFEAEIVTITGTTPAGVALAARAFLANGLVNGVVAAPGWKRTQPNLLERDPLAPDFALPPFLPESAAGLPRIGVTQSSEDEYRGVLSTAGVEPAAIWRVKYHRPDAWDGAGAKSAFSAYAGGLQRRAYGDTLWCARFATSAEAAEALPKIAHAANLQKDNTLWRGAQPPYANGTYAGDSPSPGPLTLWQRGEWLLMSTLPDTPTQDLVRATTSENR